MDKIKFDNTFDLVISIKGLLDNIDTDYPVIAVYGKYDVIKELLEELITSGVPIANEIELHDYDVSNYDKEFVLYLNSYGVNVEKTFYAIEYYYGSADIAFVHEDCSSKLLKYIDSDTIYEFTFNRDDYKDNDCKDDDYECNYCENDNYECKCSSNKNNYEH